MKNLSNCTQQDKIKTAELIETAIYSGKECLYKWNKYLLVLSPLNNLANFN